MHRNKWKQPLRRGNKHPTRGSAPYNVYEANDGHIAIICVKDDHWFSLLRLFNREDLIVDQRFATQALRALNEDAVDELVENWTKTKTKDEAVKLLANNFFLHHFKKRYWILFFCIIIGFVILHNMRDVWGVNVCMDIH